jgi:uncharacterized membrane protein
MEAMFILLGLGILGTVVIGSILGIIAFSRTVSSDRKVESLRLDVKLLTQRLLATKVPKLKPEEPLVTFPPVKETPPPPPPLPKETTPAPQPSPSLFPEIQPERTTSEKWARFEEIAGKMWMAWVGAVVLFLAAGFFVKYAIDNGWIGPTARVVLGMMMGVAMLAAGDRSIRKDMRKLGEALIGGGLAILYVSIAASYSLYDLIPQPAAFGAMVLVTAAGMTLAVLHNALATVFLAVLGGFITPLLVSTGQDPRDGLFSYLLMLDLGVMAVAFFKRWRALDILAYIGTAVSFIAWHDGFYTDSAMVPALIWLGIYYVVFMLIPFAYHIRSKTPIALERFLMAIANSVFVFTFAYIMLHEDYLHALGFIALAMAAFNIAMGKTMRKAIPSDTTGLFGFVAMAVSFLTIAAPLHLKLHGITLVWAIEVPALLFLGYRYKYRPVRIGAFIILIVSFIRVFAVHWPMHSMLFVPFLNKSFGTVIFVPVMAGVFALIHHIMRRDEEDIERPLKFIAGIGGALFALMLFRTEIVQWLGYSDYRYASRCAGAIVWALGSAAFLFAGTRSKNYIIVLSGLLPLLFAVTGSLALYSSSILHDYTLILNLRFLAGLLTAAVLFFHGSALHRHGDIDMSSRALSTLLLSAGGIYLLILLSTENYSFCHEAVDDGRKANWIANMALSLTWGGYAAIALAIGFWKNIRTLRFSALALFGIAAMKLVLVDIAGVQQVYRIVSFFVMGILMMGTAYLYSKLEKKLVPYQEDKAE